MPEHQPCARWTLQPQEKLDKRPYYDLRDDNHVVVGKLKSDVAAHDLEQAFRHLAQCDGGASRVAELVEQVDYLESRVDDLEEENRKLRAQLAAASTSGAAHG